MDANASLMNSLMTLLGLTGVIQGIGMKYSKSVRKKLMLDAKGVDKKYISFKINFLIITGSVLLIIQTAAYFSPALGDKLQILLSAFLLLAITADLVYKKFIRKR
ncbi:hypothetical protein N4T77_06285 [Clostridium sp. CX1]|uniref:DUF3784 domain-containing protein n=1 Tax=Clostridium tanneri TaxID=3037988 RepID=A0ABU4JNT2_9CLOT|nr:MULTISPECIES: hypothetical protein [unclassified Clostridium]MCT8976201.1 hypothetical protein [Clostridium sp. CX1]MDW8799767.1 hypothetical protein [Clostridium sp. A1-XYC3]